MDRALAPELHEEIASLYRQARTRMQAVSSAEAARSGYIPDDASFGKNTFEVLSSRLNPGARSRPSSTAS
jgi:hypothetical protein